MTFVAISGDPARLDAVLEYCLGSGVFQPESATRLSEYSIGAPSLLRNPYGGLLVKLGETADQLGILLEYRDDAALEERVWEREKYLEESFSYLTRLYEEYTQCHAEKKRLAENIAAYDAALKILSKVRDGSVDFDKIFSGGFLKIRFGRLPTGAEEELEARGAPLSIHPLGSEPGYTWCVCATAPRFAGETDALLREVGFQRLRVPEFVHGNAQSAEASLRGSLDRQREESRGAVAKLDALVEKERAHLLMLYSRTKFLHGAWELRRYVVSLQSVFHLVGFVPKKAKAGFVEGLSAVEDIRVQTMPAEEESRIPTPVRLKNNWLARPYEMFVSMYGTPSYGDIDPTPFVAVTYTLLFGMMFGDVGQGLCIFLLGLFLHKKKKMPLGGIMSRAGLSSACFGLVYGSVFGFENLLDPLYRALGFHEKPIEVLRPDTTTKLLLAAVALGTVIILAAMLFNLCVGLKHRDPERLLLSSNGLPGIVFYVSVLAAVLASMRGKSLLSTPYILCLLALPLLVIFLREPLARVMHAHKGDTIIHHHRTLLESTVFRRADTHLHQLFTTEFVASRFGRLPTGSYEKLHFYGDEPFLLYPLKSDRTYIWCIYTMPAGDQSRVDAIFQSLYFEQIPIPEESLGSGADAERFIKERIDSFAREEETLNAGNPLRKITVWRTMFPDGVAAFFTESFFELFEVLLSFVTNTMSFLRVGGFILSHAGMMSVVFTLSHMVGAGASPLVIAVGNLFVMGLEGLIVGIQALRLEFYEIFSRFFDADGDPYAPACVDYRPRAG